MNPRKMTALPALALSFLLCTVACADQQELQLGYVFDGWNSNSLFHGTENRIPLSYYYSAKDLSLSLSSAFVAGDYVKDGISEFNSSQFSDTTLRASLGLDMGGSVKSSFSGSLNLPTGNDNWEIAEEVGAIPFIFEPGYYHGAGWGGDLFYTLSADSAGMEYGLGGGFMSTGNYDTGISAEGTFSPGNNFVALATIGFQLSPAESWSFRYVRTFPTESTYGNAAQDFTEGPGNIVSTQWFSQMGGDRLVLNASYGFYGVGQTAQPNAPYSLSTDPGPYFGDKLEVHPIFGYSMGPGVVLESGLLFDWIQPNGYPNTQVVVGTADSYQGGGVLLGAEQSLTFQLDPGTFFNLAGLYHYIANDNADSTHTLEVIYNRFSVGTNVGFKW